MITESFDNKSPAVIDPVTKKNAVKCDVVIVTFSNHIEQHVVNTFDVEKVVELVCVNGITPAYIFKHNGKTFGFLKTLLGSAAAVGTLEDAVNFFECDKILVFGSAGTLDKNHYGKVMVPTFAYRDEGTSYHYKEASDYIEIKNSNIVADFMNKNNIPFVLGKCWTTDAFYRETKNNLKKRQDDGCVSVDMECSAIQAMCDFREVNLFYFFLSGDLLDSPKWIRDGLNEANHNFQNFQIALKLACDLCEV